MWIVLYLILKGHSTLPLAPSDMSRAQSKLNDLNNWVGDNQNSNPVFLHFFNEIRAAIGWLVTGMQHLISQPVGTRPLPIIGWMGVLGHHRLASWAWGNLRVAVLAVAGFAFMGLQGLWQESMDTLALTLVVGGRRAGDRHPARGLGRYLQAVRGDHHAGPGLHADPPDVHLSAAARRWSS